MKILVINSVTFKITIQDENTGMNSITIKIPILTAVVLVLFAVKIGILENSLPVLSS